ncbi:DUF3267 domain-containing protein [Clostridium gasigenes]|uniref:Putative zincin peptidase n=1 Tax=Clostridium gasigenes TaxID=94869 RepID=A0A1H0PSG6_9CLOT|nr:DUF3267 domain-containing protein [Clostridium gasigenes]MBU3088227.1 DUF3267 domain-containing protein [Clostridium gasigenes]SDP08091.1 Putative zincin peptidase [Clostridium gasigenes]
MYTIKYMGKYKDESQILKGDLPKQAIQYKEPDNVTSAFLIGALISSPIIIILLILILCKIEIWDITFKNINVLNLVITTMVASILSLVFVIIHEFLHAFCYPKNVIKEIWFKPNELAAFVYCNAPVSKGNFIWIVSCPNVVLGLIPYILWMLGVFDSNSLVSQTIIIFAMLNIISGVGDYLNAYLTIKQVPQNALVQNYGFHTYWFL